MDSPSWTFLSNHGHVLVALSRNADARVSDIARAVGITDRAVHGIISDLTNAGYVDKARSGRRNHYDLHPEVPMRHPLEAGHLVGELLEAIGELKPGDDTTVVADRSASG